MSRCFPYPPPGYTLSRANKEALIESIELQKEKEKSILELKQKSDKEHKSNKEKSKKEHKEKKEKSKNEHKEKDKELRKKDKEQRKKEKREKDKIKEKDQLHQKLHKSDADLGNSGEKLSSYAKCELIHKGFEAEPTQLERSNLTEEHGQAACPNAPSTSSDSTENSNKRKRQSSPEDVVRVGKIIRIKLSKKPDDSGPSTSGRAQLPTQPRNDVGLAHTRNGMASTSNDLGKSSQCVAGTTVGEQICAASQQVHTFAPVQKPTKIPVMSPMQKMELEYSTLFENLVQPQVLDSFLPDDDLDWLKPAKKLDRSSETKLMSGNASTCSGCQPLWPRAQYLQEVDVYALPYTVPF